MPIIVTGTSVSTRTQRVVLVLEEIGLPYELRTVDLRNGEHKTPGFRMKYNPFGKVPVFEHGDTKLFESRAICRYLAAKYKSPLMPENIEVLGFFEQIDSVGYGFFDTAVDYVADEMIFRRNSVEGEMDQRRIDINKRIIAECLDYYDGILGEHDYLAGNDLSLVDLFHAPAVNFISTRLGLDHEITSRPNVKAWWEKVTSRASWKAVMARVKSS
ncbi:hypothetical protein NM208_g7710 [Fusarium decemcellulare]|uniref:Uncharacterized protein n=1 Tax=Fusarium decemcellulare TaxID=57161 RepID=A0ACC1S855_9HYPO|nr:hypothetical protein NM208_g7710 [Fusarium decemcellulare]